MAITSAGSIAAIASFAGGHRSPRQDGEQSANGKPARDNTPSPQPVREPGTDDPEGSGVTKTSARTSPNRSLSAQTLFDAAVISDTFRPRFAWSNENERRAMAHEWAPPKSARPLRSITV